MNKADIRNLMIKKAREIKAGEHGGTPEDHMHMMHGLMIAAINLDSDCPGLRLEWRAIRQNFRDYRADLRKEVDA